MEISCNVIRDLLPLYAEDMVSEDSREIIDKHLGDCQCCRDQLDAMRVSVEIPAEGGQGLIHTAERITRTVIVCAMASILVLITLAGVAFSIMIYPLQGEMEDVLVSVREEDGVVLEELTLEGATRAMFFHRTDPQTGENIKIMSYYRSVYNTLFGTVSVSDNTYINDYDTKWYRSVWYYQDGELIHLWGDETEPNIQLQEESPWLHWSLGLGVVLSLTAIFLRYEKFGNVAMFAFNVALADLITTGGHWFPFARTPGDIFFLQVWIIMLAFLLTFSIITCRYLWRNRRCLF